MLIFVTTTVWQHIGQNIVATNMHHRDMTSDVTATLSPNKFMFKTNNIMYSLMCTDLLNHCASISDSFKNLFWCIQTDATLPKAIFQRGFPNVDYTSCVKNR